MKKTLEILNANTNENTKTLLQEHPQAFKELYRIFGIDFNADYTMLQISNFTINQVLNYFGSNGKTIIFFNNLWHKDRCYFIAEIKSGKVNIDLRPRYNSGLDYFFRKSDFEEYRKESTQKIYVLHSENIIEKKNIYFNKNERFKVVPGSVHSYYTHICGADIPYVARADFKGENGFVYEYRNSWFKLDLNDIIDKSGYLVNIRRDELKTKTNRLIEQRQKEKADLIDKTTQKSLISANIEYIKNELANRLSMAKTANEVDRVANKMTRFAWLYRDCISFCERCDTNSFSSIERFEYQFENLKKSCNDFIEKLKETTTQKTA